MFPPVDADKMNLDYCMRLLPHHADTGGFFVAVLEKTAKLPWQAEEKKCPAPVTDNHFETCITLFSMLRVLKNLAL